MRVAIAVLVVLCFVGAFAANLDHMRRHRMHDPPAGQKQNDATKGGKEKTDKPNDKPTDAAGQKPNDASAKPNDVDLDTLTVVSCFSEQLAQKKDSSKKGANDAAAAGKKNQNSADDDDDDGDDDDLLFLQVFGGKNLTRGVFAAKVGSSVSTFCANVKPHKKQDANKQDAASKKQDATKKQDAAGKKPDAGKPASFLEEDPAEVDEDASAPKDGLNQKGKKKGEDAAGNDKPKDGANDKPKDAAADKPKDDKPKDDKKPGKAAVQFCHFVKKLGNDLAKTCAKYKNDLQPDAPLFHHAGAQQAAASSSTSDAAPNQAAPSQAASPN